MAGNEWAGDRYRPEQPGAHPRTRSRTPGGRGEAVSFGTHPYERPPGGACRDVSEESGKNPEAVGGDRHIHEDHDRSFEDKLPQREDGVEDFRPTSARSSAGRGGYGFTGTPPGPRGSRDRNAVSGRMPPSSNASRNAQRFKEELSKKLKLAESRIFKQHEQEMAKLVRENELQLSQLRENLHTMQSVHVKIAAGVSTGQYFQTRFLTVF